MSYENNEPDNRDEEEIDTNTAPLYKLRSSGGRPRDVQDMNSDEWGCILLFLMVGLAIFLAIAWSWGLIAR